VNRDLLIGLDSSTSATKAIAWTRVGEPVAEGRSAIPLSRPAADWYEQSPGDWWNSACAALRDLLARISPERIAALGISAQRETFVPLAEDGSPIRPAIIWLDQRCRDEVSWLSGLVGSARIHEISGKPVDMAPVAYRMAWMLRHEPDAYRRTAIFADVHGYLTWRLTGRFRTSSTSADPLGLFDMRKKEWSAEILQALQVKCEQLPEIAPPGSVLGEVTECAAAATSLPAGTPIIAGGGDGQAAGLGVNALNPGRAYLNLGTAVVAGIQSNEYRIGQAWRTMGSGCGEGYCLETSLRSGTFLVDWFLQNCAGGEVRQRLESEAADLPIGSGGLLAVPYWGAVMTPYWDPDARGCLLGLTGAHRTAHIYRALLEGIALEQAMVTAMIERDAGIEVREFVAIGGGAASDLWRQIVADACGKPVRRSRTVEASSLGAAMCAAAGAGWFDSPRAAAEAMSGEIVHETEPCNSRVARYAELLDVYREIYPQLRRTYRKLAEFMAARGSCASR
jgi:xylulokinase